jgi:hypothetical protein
VAVVAAGCSVGRPAGFMSRSNQTCADADQAIMALANPDDPSAALRYALDRYVIIEKAVATVTDASLPGGATGRDLRSRWLRPARASLARGRAELEDLRQAVRGGHPGAARPAFEVAVVTGTAGVDTGYLHEQRLDRCATVFTPLVPDVAW